jgi:hypothetical protein
MKTVTAHDPGPTISSPCNFSFPKYSWRFRDGVKTVGLELAAMVLKFQVVQTETLCT